MKFDTIIIGGGLSGLTCGIKLAEKGKKCAIVSTGQSAIHFFSGSFDLLSKLDDGQEVKNPIESASLLPNTHPYRRLGEHNMAALASEVTDLFQRAAIEFSGNPLKNHYVLTPLGTLKPTWLTIRDFQRFEAPENLQWKQATIVNLDGFLDFHTQFVSDSLSKLGVECHSETIALKQLEAIRRNPSEMRATNIAKVFDASPALDDFAQKVNEIIDEAAQSTDVVILPAVFGLLKQNATQRLNETIKKPISLIPVIPPSVPGIRTQNNLRNRFKELGGTYFLGDTVVEGNFNGNKLVNLTTKNHSDIKLEAEQFVLASGSFFSKGIVASPEKLFEPIFGLDIDGADDRSKWFDPQIGNEQPFMRYGVKTDEQFRVHKNGNTVENLFAAGSVLSGAKSIKEGSGAGVSILTALHVAEQIIQE